MNNERRRETLRAAADDFWDMLLLNIVYVFTCLPVITYGAAAGALYSAVAHLDTKQRHGGAVAMYWTLLKRNFRRSVLLWCVVLALAVLSAVDLAVIGQMPGMLKYCSYGLQFFVLLLLQVVVTLGFPIISETGLPAKEAVKRSFEMLGKEPLRVLFSCLIQATPAAVLLLAPNVFAGLFLLWITVYFSFGEKLISAVMETRFEDMLRKLEDNE